MTHVKSADVLVSIPPLILISKWLVGPIGNIEFPCLNCHAVLAAPDRKAGQTIDCPNCDEPLVVPVQDQHKNTASFRQQFEDNLAERMRPFSGRQSDAEITPSPTASRELASHTIELDTWYFDSPAEESCIHCGGKCFSEKELCHNCVIVDQIGPRSPMTLISLVAQTWKFYLQNLGACLIVGMLDLILTTAAFLFAVILAFSSAMLLQFNETFATVAFFVVLVAGLSLFLGSLAAGNIRFFLALVRNEPLEFGRLFQFDPQAGRILVAGSIYWGLTFVGICCGIIPGLIVLIRYWPYGRLIIDRNQSISTSIVMSGKLTQAFPITLLGMFFVQFLVLILTAGIPILGPALAFPFVAILYSVTYLRLLEELQIGSTSRSVL